VRVVACLACRNNSKRLYGKPLQRLGKQTVLEYIINNLKRTAGIDEVVLAISEAPGNEVFQQFAIEKGIPYVFGDDKDVLKRLIIACQLGGGDTVFRLTTESPFTYLEGFSLALDSHKASNAEYTAYSHMPDGSGFEILSLDALKRSHRDGTDKHRSELCSLYMYENRDKFKFNIIAPPEKHQRPNYRLTIDFPEDLILCRKIVIALGEDGYLEFDRLIPFLDENPELRKLVENLTDASYVIYTY
jgi:spore coat polysaccharide biosynthesis protein SpsF (cytidylyltransferase family)